MAILVQDVINGILSRLNEAANSPAGALESGTGGTPILATPDLCVKLINEAKNDLCRFCLPIEDHGTFSVPAGTRFVSFNQLTTTGDGLIWQAYRNGVQWNTTTLFPCSRGQAELYYPNGPFDANGLPVSFVAAGPEGIQLAPKPNAQQTLTIWGFATPADYTVAGAGSTNVTFIEPDEVRLLEFYGAAYIGKKNWEDPSLQNRAGMWMDEYNAGKLALAQRLLKSDPSTVATYFPQTIAALRGGGGGPKGK